MKKYAFLWYLKILGAAAAVNCFIELLGRKSAVFMWKYMVENPAVFFINTAIILMLFLPVLFTKRKWFACILALSVWIFAGVVNGVLLTFRTTPFTAADFRLVKYALGMLTTYMSWPEIILSAAGIIGAAILCAVLWKKAPVEKEKIPFWLGAIIAGVNVGGMFFLVNWGISHNLLSVQFGNIGQAFKEYGFPYCFSNSLVNTGISKPGFYDEKLMQEIEKELRPAYTYDVWEEQPPNIIMVQLESFFDPYLWINNPVKEDPIPFFRYLKNHYPSGYLKVPSVGAGTANTEFECITGMNLDFFGPGEYPYKTILRKTTCESLPFDLMELGYSTHAIHNNEATFYDRNRVFSQLGFETFTPIEYMSNIEKNPIGWCKDKILTGEIVKALDSTEGQDFIYTISVQGHGAYPDFSYYCSQIKEMDDFVRDLIRTLNSREEPTVVVLYGDHLPGFSWDASEMLGGSLYQTQYVVWNNLGLPEEKRNVESYQLGAYVLNMLGIHEGVMTRFHQAFLDGRTEMTIQGSLVKTKQLQRKRKIEEEKYLEDMEALEYDMLYGDREIYGGESPFKATKLQFGIEPVTVDEIVISDHRILVYGEGFNAYSKIFIDGKMTDTMYVWPELIISEKLTEKKANGISKADIQVWQTGKDKVPLGQAD